MPTGADLDAALDALQASLDADVIRNQTNDAAYKAEIARLQALVDAGTATQAQIDRLAAMKLTVDGLNVTSPVVIPPEDLPTA